MNKRNLIMGGVALVLLIATYSLTQKENKEEAPPPSSTEESVATKSSSVAKRPPVSKTIRISVDKTERDALDINNIDPTTVTVLKAPGRQAWKLEDLLGPEYLRDDIQVVIESKDGGKRTINTKHDSQGPAILVEREDGSQYLGWLIVNWEAHGERLADAEAPGQRIDNIVAVSIETRPNAEPQADGKIDVIVDGNTVRTLNPDWVVDHSSANVENKKRGSGPAIDIMKLAKSETGSSSIEVSVTDGKKTLKLSDGPANARGLLYFNRRRQFKFAWIGSDDKPIQGTPQLRIKTIQIQTI